MDTENVRENEKDEVQVMPEPVTLVPLVDILEGENGVTVQFEVPGANSGTVDIEVLNGVLTMTAKSSLRRNGRRSSSGATSGFRRTSTFRRFPRSRGTAS